jgi:hypothetical protein
VTAARRPVGRRAAGAPSTSDPAAASPGSQPQQGPRSAHSSLPEAAQIEGVAKRFSEAFVHYEVGQLSPWVRRGIEATTTLQFATSLLSAPPNIPYGVRPPAPARLRSLALANGPRSGHALVAVELNGELGQVEPLTLLMQRLGQEWRISGLR